MMEKIAVYNYFLLFLFTGCDKDEDSTNKIIDRHYKGTFQRELVWEELETANVTFTFSSNEWSGSSDKYKYPALSHGTYSIIGDSILFYSDGYWTAEFDWSLILSGKYSLTVNGDRVEITRDYRSASSDTYIDRICIV